MKRYIKCDDEFLNYGDSDTRLHMAGDPTTSPEVLATLAKDYTSSIIREYVARNPNTPVSALKRLAKDGDESVRSAVAFNASTPVEILNVLASDWYMGVSNNVARNHNATSETMDILAKSNPDWQTCQDIAENPKTTTETLDYLSTLTPRHHLFEFYKKIITNPNASLQALTNILDTRDGEWLITRYTDRSDILDVIAQRKQAKRNRRKNKS